MYIYLERYGNHQKNQYRVKISIDTIDLVYPCDSISKAADLRNCFRECSELTAFEFDDENSDKSIVAFIKIADRCYRQCSGERVPRKDTKPPLAPGPRH